MIAFRHMRLASITLALRATLAFWAALAFWAPAFAQTTPHTSQAPSTDKLSDAWRQRLKDLKLIDPEHITIQRMARAAKPTGCAIRLLNALPAHGTADYKIRTVKPPANVEHSEAVAPQIGLPACEPGLFALNSPGSEKK